MNLVPICISLNRVKTKDVCFSFINLPTISVVFQKLMKKCAIYHLKDNKTQMSGFVTREYTAVDKSNVINKLVIEENKLEDKCCNKK